jgi:hypothetical protein
MLTYSGSSITAQEYNSTLVAENRDHHYSSHLDSAQSQSKQASRAMQASSSLSQNPFFLCFPPDRFSSLAALSRLVLEDLPSVFRL